MMERLWLYRPYVSHRSFFYSVGLALTLFLVPHNVFSAIPPGHSSIIFQEFLSRPIVFKPQGPKESSRISKKGLIGILALGDS